MTLSPNRTQFILDRPMTHAPGGVFNYTDANPNLAFPIITRLTGKLAEDYAREKLFSPLGITDWHWDRDPQGLTMGAWTLTMLPRDMAKIGYLYLRRGEWEGKQLLPIGWANVLKHATVNMHASFDPGLRYSNFFWVFGEHHVYMAVGWHGQLSAAFPDLDAVAVVTAHKFVRFGDVIRVFQLRSNPSWRYRQIQMVPSGLRMRLKMVRLKNRPPLVLRPRSPPPYRERPISFPPMCSG